MIIWIIDCATCYCTKVTLSAEKEKELDEKYEFSVEDFLYDHQDVLGISLKYCNWLVSNEDYFDEINL